MLAIDRQQNGTAVTQRLHEQGTGHDQRLLVGQQHPLAGLHRRERRLQPCRPDDGGHYHVHLRVRCHFAQPTFAVQHASADAIGMQLILQYPRLRLITNDRIAWSVLEAERTQLGKPTEAGQGENIVAIRMAGDDIERAQADRAGRAQYGDLQRSTHNAPQPASHSNTTKTGMAAVRLSMRSITPPWPGSS